MGIEAKLGDFLWQSWTNLYTDLLPRSDWLILFDHLVTYPEYPELFCLLAVVELSQQKNALLSCPDKATLDAVLEQVKIDNVKETLARSVDYLAAVSKLPEYEYPFRRALPLTRDTYQAFSFLPRSLIQSKY